MGIRSTLARSPLLPGLLAVLGVVLIAAGLAISGAIPLGTSLGAPGGSVPPAATSTAANSPGSTGSPMPSGSPEATASPDDSGSANPGASPTPVPSGAPKVPSSPAGTPGPTGPTATPAASVRPPTSTRVATRVVVAALGIDLPVVHQPGGADSYPACDVAMYLDGLSQPGLPGATYLYAHARVGMFLPILDASRVDDGRQMIGMVVRVYTSDNRYFEYEVVEVRRHQLTLADALAAGDEQLWLQTSEGPKGTPGKTQVIAVPIGSGPALPKDAHPVAHPVACG